MLAYCYVIIDDVDPQLRQHLVFAECSAGKCKNRPLFLITRVYLLTLSIMTYVLRKNIYFLSISQLLPDSAV